jgi:cobalt-zinc-cadmium efflux system outer membrane protein
LGTRSVSARESVAVSFPFRWGGQKSSARSAAESDRDAAARSRDATIAEARRAGRTAWYTLAAGEDLLRAAEELVSRSERNRRAISELLDQERASRLDLLRATAETAMASAARAAAEKTVISASASLRALLGYGETRLSAGTTRPTPPPAGSIDDWRQLALAASPDLVVATAKLQAAEARVSQRKRENRPSASFQAGADWNDPTQPGTDALLGFGLTFPTRGRAAVELAEAERDRAAASLELAGRRVRADLETAWSATESARQRFEAVDGVALPAATEAAELTRIGYAEGRLDLFRLLDAERSLAGAEQDRADAYRDWGTAYADLLRLVPEAAP